MRIGFPSHGTWEQIFAYRFTLLGRTLNGHGLRLGSDDGKVGDAKHLRSLDGCEKVGTGRTFLRLRLPVENVGNREPALPCPVKRDNPESHPLRSLLSHVLTQPFRRSIPAQGFPSHRKALP